MIQKLEAEPGVGVHVEGGTYDIAAVYAKLNEVIAALNALPTRQDVLGMAQHAAAVYHPDPRTR